MTHSAQTDAALVRMLQMARASGAAAKDEPAASDYDWRRPYRFTPAQLGRLGEFARQCAERLSGVLGASLRAQVALQAGPLSQHYTGDISQPPEGQVQQCLALAGKDGKACGVVAVRQVDALGWVARLLGAAPAATSEDRELSVLENDLLVDLVARLAENFAEQLQAGGGPSLQAGEKLTKNQYALLGGMTDDYCRIALSSEGAQDPSAATITVIVPSEAMLVLAGKSAAAAQADRDERKEMLAHAGRAVVPGRLRLGGAAVTMGDVMQLMPGDILVIDRRIDEPVELLVQGKPVLSGYLAASEGRYALTVHRGLSGPGAVPPRPAAR